MNLDKIFPAFFFLCVGIGALIGHAGGSALSTANGAAIGVAVGLSPLLVLALFVGGGVSRWLHTMSNLSSFVAAREQQVLYGVRRVAAWAPLRVSWVVEARVSCAEAEDGRR